MLQPFYAIANTRTAFTSFTFGCRDYAGVNLLTHSIDTSLVYTAGAPGWQHQFLGDSTLFVPRTEYLQRIYLSNTEVLQG